MQDAPSYSSYGRANASASAPDGGEPQQLVSWTFAGFADGSVAVFDERIPSTAALGGRVHCAREHGAWVVSAHLRSDGIPEVSMGRYAFLSVLFNSLPLFLSVLGNNWLGARRRQILGPAVHAHFQII